MKDPFSSIEIQLIRSSLNTRTDFEIAELIDRPVDQVIKKIDELTGGLSAERSDRVAELKEREALLQQEKEQKKDRALKNKIATEEKKKRNEQKSLQRQIRMQMADQLKQKQRASIDRRVYKTKPVDLSQLISVRIDHKTTVHVKPGTDIEAVKMQYSKKPVIRDDE